MAFKITPDEFVKLATEHIHLAMVNRIRDAIHKQIDPLVEEAARDLALTLKGVVIERFNAVDLSNNFYFVFKENPVEKL